MFKDECDHIGEKTCLKDVTSRVPFERKKLDLSIFIFNEPINGKLFENIAQEPQIDKSFKNLFENEFNRWAESIRETLVSYIPAKDMVNSSLEEMYKEKLKILGIHIIYVPTTMYNQDEFLKRGGGKKSRMKLRKEMNKLERMNIKLTKRLTSPISPLKMIHWSNGKRARGKKLRKLVTSPLLYFIS